MTPSDIKTVRLAALNYLGRRDHSHTELLRKLRQKQFTEDLIHHVLDTLTREGLLSNQRFVENYIHFRRKKGFGPLRIHAELRERGLDEEVIEHHLQIIDNAWLEDVQRTWKKRFKGVHPQDFKTRAAQMRFLHYRGYTQDQIDSVLTSD